VITKDPTPIFLLIELLKNVPVQNILVLAGIVFWLVPFVCGWLNRSMVKYLHMPFAGARIAELLVEQRESRGNLGWIAETDFAELHRSAVRSRRRCRLLTSVQESVLLTVPLVLYGLAEYAGFRWPYILGLLLCYLLVSYWVSQSILAQLLSHIRPFDLALVRVREAKRLPPERPDWV